MKTRLTKLVRPSCTPLAVVFAGAILQAWSGSFWPGLAIAAGLGIGYGLLLEALRRIVRRWQVTS